MVEKSFRRSVDLVNAANTKIKKNQLIIEKDRILVSFSGGQDSICLLLLLNQLYAQMELHLALFWCHHLWQIDSFSLMRQITKLSFLFQFNSSFAITSKFVPNELLARNWRHSCSHRICLFYNYSKISLAHSANDKVETILLNLMRGTGITGLSPLHWIKTIPERVVQKEEHTSQLLTYQFSSFSWLHLKSQIFTKREQINETTKFLSMQPINCNFVNWGGCGINRVSSNTGTWNKSHLYHIQFFITPFSETWGLDVKQSPNLVKLRSGCFSNLLANFANIPTNFLRLAKQVDCPKGVGSNPESNVIDQPSQPCDSGKSGNMYRLCFLITVEGGVRARSIHFYPLRESGTTPEGACIAGRRAKPARSGRLVGEANNLSGESILLCCPADRYDRILYLPSEYYRLEAEKFFFGLRKQPRAKTNPSKKIALKENQVVHFYWAVSLAAQQAGGTKPSGWAIGLHPRLLCNPFGVASGLCPRLLRKPFGKSLAFYGVWLVVNYQRERSLLLRQEHPFVDSTAVGNWRTVTSKDGLRSSPSLPSAASLTSFARLGRQPKEEAMAVLCTKPTAAFRSKQAEENCYNVVSQSTSQINLSRLIAWSLLQNNLLDNSFVKSEHVFFLLSRGDRISNSANDQRSWSLVKKYQVNYEIGSIFISYSFPKIATLWILEKILLKKRKKGVLSLKQLKIQNNRSKKWFYFVSYAFFKACFICSEMNAATLEKI